LYPDKTHTQRNIKGNKNMGLGEIPMETFEELDEQSLEIV
jgi:hypothetical protein